MSRTDGAPGARTKSRAPTRRALAPILALLTGLVFAACSRDTADRPEPVAWDRVSCARCGMLVGEPGFAAQIRTTMDEVLFFDDPGCLLLHDHENPGEARSRWFHHAHEDRWIEAELVRFVPAASTPMSYGLGAVDEASADSLSYAQALRALLERETQRRRR